MSSTTISGPVEGVEATGTLSLASCGVCGSGDD